MVSKLLHKWLYTESLYNICSRQNNYSFCTMKHYSKLVFLLCWFDKWAMKEICKTIHKIRELQSYFSIPNYNAELEGQGLSMLFFTELNYISAKKKPYCSKSQLNNYKYLQHLSSKMSHVYFIWKIYSIVLLFLLSLHKKTRFTFQIKGQI